jgi:cell division initiation protein
MRGYSTVEVDEHINFIIEKYTELYRENDELERRLKNAEAEIEAYKKDEESIRSAMVNAQHASAKIESEASEKAELLLRSTRGDCDKILTEFRAQIRVERDRLEKLRAVVAQYKAHMLDQYQSHIELLEQIAPDYAADQLKLGSDEVYTQQVIDDVKTDLRSLNAAQEAAAERAKREQAEREETIRAADAARASGYRFGTELESRVLPQNAADAQVRTAPAAAAPAPVSPAAAVRPVSAAKPAPVAETPVTKLAPTVEAPAAKPAPVAETPAAKPAPVAEAPAVKSAPVAEAPAAKPAPVVETSAAKPAPAAESPAVKPSEAPAPEAEDFSDTRETLNNLIRSIGATPARPSKSASASPAASASSDAPAASDASASPAAETAGTAAKAADDPVEEQLRQLSEMYGDTSGSDAAKPIEWPDAASDESADAAPAAAPAAAADKPEAASGTGSDAGEAPAAVTPRRSSSIRDDIIALNREIGGADGSAAPASPASSDDDAEYAEFLRNVTGAAAPKSKKDEGNGSRTGAGQQSGEQKPAGGGKLTDSQEFDAIFRKNK